MNKEVFAVVGETEVKEGWVCSNIGAQWRCNHIKYTINILRSPQQTRGVLRRV